MSVKPRKSTDFHEISAPFNRQAEAFGPKFAEGLRLTGGRCALSGAAAALAKIPANHAI